MTIQHHLDDATLLAYAAGTLDEAFSVIAASHIAWCPECRAQLRRAEALGAELMSGLEDSQVSDSCRKQTLANLDRAILHRFPALGRVASDLPYPLGKVLGNKSLSEIPWRWRAPGVAMFDIALPCRSRGQLRLMRIAPGRAMPEHGHGGEEMTMILSGAYNDSIGRFARGDVADLDEMVEHRPVVEQDEPCVCLVATEAPTRFKSTIARILQPMLGI